jgi:hypothetical protein
METYPKNEFIITRISDKGNLSGEGKGKAIFRNYKAYLDIIDIYELIANDWNALRGIKFEFKYDYWYKGKVKNIYKDEFNRIVKVKKLNQ